MTAFQTYAEAPTAGQAGHICGSTGSNGQGRTLVRAIDAAVDCALAVTPGATPGKTVKAPTTAAEAVACEGILLDPVYLNEIGATNSYSAGQAATLLEDGYMWVNSEGTVAFGDPVFVRILSDGSSNTVKGTLTNTSDYPAGGVVLTPGASLTAAVTTFSVTLGNGTTQETFIFTSDASPTAAEVSAGLVALIDASSNFAATGSTTISITSTSGIVEVLGIAGSITVTTPARAHRRPGWRWAKARTGAGLTKIQVQPAR